MGIKPQPSEGVDLLPNQNSGDASPPVDPRLIAIEETKKEKDDVTIRINSIGENNPVN